MSIRVRKKDGSTTSFNPLSVLTDPAKARAAAQSIRKKSDRKAGESSRRGGKKDEATPKAEEEPAIAEEAKTEGAKPEETKVEETKAEGAPEDLQEERDELPTVLESLDLRIAARSSGKGKAGVMTKVNPKGKTRAQPTSKKPFLGVSRAGRFVFGPRSGSKDEADGDPRWPEAEATDADFEESEVPYSDNLELNPIQLALLMQLNEEYEEARYITLASRFLEETGIRVSGEEMRHILDRRSSR